MPEEVYEWFALVGYEATLATMMKAEVVDGGPDHAPHMKISCNDETEQITVSVDDIDRRVVFDDDFGWLCQRRGRSGGGWMRRWMSSHLYGRGSYS